MEIFPPMVLYQLIVYNEVSFVSFSRGIVNECLTYEGLIFLQFNDRSCL